MSAVKFKIAIRRALEPSFHCPAWLTIISSQARSQDLEKGGAILKE